MLIQPYKPGVVNLTVYSPMVELNLANWLVCWACRQMVMLTY